MLSGLRKKLRRLPPLHHPHWLVWLCVITVLTLGFGATSQFLLSTTATSTIISAPAVACPELKAGDRFKVAGFNAVYLLNDNRERLYFPHSEVYHTWFQNFSGVIKIEPLCIDTYPIPTRPPYGVNYRPGTRLVKLKVSPHVYVIEPGNRLAKLGSEKVAEQLYGQDWRRLVRDLNDEFWPNFVAEDPPIVEPKPHDGMIVTTRETQTAYYVQNGRLHPIEGNLSDLTGIRVHTLPSVAFAALEKSSSTLKTKEIPGSPIHATIFVERITVPKTPNLPGATTSTTSTTIITPPSTTGKTISGFFDHYCAVMDDKTIKCWGTNGYGELGNGTKTYQGTPVLVANISNAIAVSAGSSHTCALLEDKTVKCWGRNISGQLGNGTYVESSIPVTVSGLSNVRAISAGNSHTCALLEDKTVKCWGANGGGSIGAGQLGDGTYINRSVPISVLNLSSVRSVDSGGQHTCAVLDDKTVRCWGDNGWGQLGNGSSGGNRNLPEAVRNITNAISVSNGFQHTCALLEDKTIKCWGENTWGELGNGTYFNRVISTPASVINNSSAGFISLDAAGQHTCAVLEDKTIKCWGLGSGGQIGNGANAEINNTPVPVLNISTAVAIAGGNNNTCALLEDGSIKCWGANIKGQLGKETIDGNSNVPVLVIGGVGSQNASPLAPIPAPTLTPTSTPTPAPAPAPPVLPTAPPATSSATSTTSTPPTTATTTPPADTTTPIISNIQVTNITETSATISWSTNEAASSSISHIASSPPFAAIITMSQDKLTHTAALNYMQAGTAYNYTISATDNSGNISVTSVQTFTTASPPPPQASPTTKWSTSTFQWIVGGAAVASDGTLYVGEGLGKLHAFDQNGALKWIFNIGSDPSTPTIAGDGTIYVGSWNNIFYAINPSGGELWRFTANGRISGSAAVAADGTIYFGTNALSLYALNPDGTQKWIYNGQGGSNASPAIATDGTIYIGNSRYLTALNPDGTQKWQFDLSSDNSGGAFYHAPTIGGDGTIYLGSSIYYGSTGKNFFAINPDGTKKWSTAIGFVQGGYYSAAIGADNTIYVSSQDRGLFAFNPDGSQKWTFASAHGAPTVGASGLIYIGGNTDNLFYALNPTGSVNWSWTVPVQYNTTQRFAPAIAADGTIYIASANNVYALVSDSNGLANSPWPKFQKNNQNTGR